MNDSQKHFISGIFSGICLTSVGYPFDTLKVRLQTNTNFSNVLDCVKKTFQTQGIRGFYYGITSPLTFSAGLNSVLFTSYNFSKKNLKFSNQNLTNFISGSFGGLCASFVMTPVELFKIQVQIQMKEKIYSGPFHAALSIYKKKGIFGFYKGLFSTIMRDIPGRGIYFYSYEKIKTYLGSEKYHILLAGGLTGTIVWGCIIPLDTIKSKVQATEGGWRECINIIYKENGIKGFYRGIIPIMLRSFPANSMSLLGYEMSMKFLNHYF